MTQERWRQVKEVFDVVVELLPTDAPAIQPASRQRLGLLDEVQSLRASDRKSVTASFQARLAGLMRSAGLEVAS